MADEGRALRILLDLTRRLTDELTLEEALQSVTDAAVELLHADHASVRLLDESGEELLCGARSGSGRSSIPVSFRPGQGIAGWAVAHGEMINAADAAKDPRFEPFGEQGFDVGSIMAVPLWSGGRVVGVLSVSSPAGSAFGPDDEILARLLANCAVPAFERARLERLAVTDPHTKAFNRRYLLPKLQEEMSRAERQGAPLSMLLMDLDHFKRVNDDHGHAAGDRVLREFADRVRVETRRQDALVRWGGEEFVLVMPDTDRDRALLVAERIRVAMSARPFTTQAGVELAQTVSIGQATWDGKETADEIERRADAAMYAAKHAGRDRVVSAENEVAS
jgi:diguanylate cyclase (GGDEF)-like protein